MSFVHGEASSADLTTAAALTLYDENGDVVTLGSDERLEIHTVTYRQTAGTGSLTFDVFQDSDDDNAVDDGERIVSGVVVASLTPFAVVPFPVPYLCKVGSVPHVIAGTAGAAVCVLTGSIRRIT